MSVNEVQAAIQANQYVVRNSEEAVYKLSLELERRIARELLQKDLSGDVKACIKEAQYIVQGIIDR